MARLDLPDKYRDEDNGSVDSPPMSDALRADERSLTEPYQLDVYEVIALAEQDAA